MSKLADKFWERMEDMYGTEWTNKHGMEPKQLWIEMLESVDPIAIKHAIKECMKSNPRAPTMPEIACYLREFNKVLQIRQQSKQLPSRKITTEEQEKAKRYIMEMSKAINKSNEM